MGAFVGGRRNIAAFDFGSLGITCTYVHLRDDIGVRGGGKLIRQVTGFRWCFMLCTFSVYISL